MRVDELFFRTAQQVPWAKLCRNVIAKIATDSGLTWVNKEVGPLYRHLAEVNSVEPQLLLIDLKQAIWKKVFKQGDIADEPGFFHAVILIPATPPSVPEVRINRQGRQVRQG